MSIIGSWLAKKGLDAAWARVFAWFRSVPPRGILIIGPGGVGKTTLAHFLAGSDYNAGGGKGEYVESISTETFGLLDDPQVQITVPPGQAHRQDATWESVLSEVKSGKIRGVILVVAYGNHTIGDISLRNHKLFDKEQGLEAFVQKYTKECLALEERILQTICEAINLCDSPVWFMTLVTKQDLWWSEKEEVEKHYSVGKYGNVLKLCKGRKTEKEFRHESAYVSLTIRNLVTGQNEILKAGNNCRLRLALARAFL